MICVECDEPVASSHTTYANDYIKLTDCPRCHRTADKYIEVDNVVLFIDILLLKPQAYKHLVFNTDFDPADDGQQPSTKHKEEEIEGFQGWLRTKKIQRIRILSILFEIYLSWAYQEKNFNASHYINANSLYHHILVKSVVMQYFYFGLKCVIEDVLTHRLVNWFVLSYFAWDPKVCIDHGAKVTKKGKKSLRNNNNKMREPKQPSLALSRSYNIYLTTVISLTILISSGTKLFPILMLIWPYDDLIITNIIVVIANFNLIESLRIVTGLRIRQTVLIFAVLTSLKFIVTRLVLSLLITHANPIDMEVLLLNELQQTRQSMLNILTWLGSYLSR